MWKQEVWEKMQKRKLYNPRSQIEQYKQDSLTNHTQNQQVQWSKLKQNSQDKRKQNKRDFMNRSNNIAPREEHKDKSPMWWDKYNPFKSKSKSKQKPQGIHCKVCECVQHHSAHYCKYCHEKDSNHLSKKCKQNPQNQHNFQGKVLEHSRFPNDKLSQQYMFTNQYNSFKPSGMYCKAVGCIENHSNHYCKYCHEKDSDHLSKNCKQNPYIQYNSQNNGFNQASTGKYQQKYNLKNKFENDMLQSNYTLASKENQRQMNKMENQKIIKKKLQLLIKQKEQQTKSMSQKLKELNQLEEFMICPINQQLMLDPYISSKCGHNFEKKSIFQWVQKNYNCPVCRKQISKDSLSANFQLKQMIEIFKKQKK